MGQIVKAAAGFRAKVATKVGKPARFFEVATHAVYLGVVYMEAHGAYGLFAGIAALAVIVVVVVGGVGEAE